MWPFSRRQARRPGLPRAAVGLLSIAAVLLPAGGIAYLGAVSYREDRGLVADTLAEQHRAAVTVTASLEAELGRTLDRVASVLGTDRITARALADLRQEHHLAAFPFRIAAAGVLLFPAPEPLRSPASSGGEFLSRAPQTCPEQAFDACIRAIREARRRAQRLDAARRRELGWCSGQPTPTATRCRASPKDRDMARRAYAALTEFEDTGPAALLGLARLALAAGELDKATAHLATLRDRFAGRHDQDGVSYQLIADLSSAEAAGDPTALLEVYRRVIERHYQAPSAVLERIASRLNDQLSEPSGPISLTPAETNQLEALRDQLQFARHQTRFAGILASEVDEIAHTAGPLTRGRPALARPERTLIYRRQPDRSIVGILVDMAMLETEAARADVDLTRLAAGTRAVIARHGDSELGRLSGPGTRGGRESLRVLISSGFGPVLPHLSLSLVNDRRMPDPLDEIVESRGRRHLAITGSLVALLLIGIIATIRSATRERELSRLKSDFVSTVSHELKTPLTSIRMFGEMLQRGVAGTDREREKRYHDIIVEESQRLGLLIANLLDYSQIERGTRHYSRRAENPAVLARDAVVTFQRFRDQPADIRLVIDGVERGHSDEREIAVGPTDFARADILADRDVVVQCLLNLLGNALKYGKPPIEVRVAADQRVTLSVSDCGPGIAKAEQERIFREFYRVPAVYSSGVEGTGLGLALVKRHVEAQGGDITVNSEPGRGATFSISFPRA
ncbi:MAG: HAMP domain-containing histidine kinase [Proteobacteria bacterium]|nr:HAMP domain-containing histidine kinase [Pseudomonadota bacterium]